MNYRVFLIFDAEEDIFGIFAYIAANDSIERATYVHNKLKETCSTLEFFPFRGHIPPELERIGVDNFLQIHFKPYRIIYTVSGTKVFVHCVLDGRRSLEDLLYRRLVR
jgi:toxin ParE1/3/4